MNNGSMERLGAACGLAAAVMLLVALFGVPLPAKRTLDRPAVVVGYLIEHKVGIEIAAGLVTVAAVLFLWFVGYLRHVLRLAKGTAAAESPIVLGAGTAVAAVAVTAMVPGAALATLVSRPLPGVGSMLGLAQTALGAPTVYTLWDLHVIGEGGCALFIALFAATAGTAMVRAGLSRAWLAWFALAVTVLEVIAGVSVFFTTTGVFVFTMLFIGATAFALWVFAAALVLLRRPVDQPVARLDAGLGS